MKSITCRHCGLVAFDDASTCKRCNKPKSVVSSTKTASRRISAWFVVSITAIAAVGLVSVRYSINTRNDADALLRREETLAVLKNKEIIGLKELLTEYEKRKRERQESQAFDNKIQELVRQGDSTELRRLRDKQDADNRLRLVEINRLKGELAAEERTLEFERNR